MSNYDTMLADLEALPDWDGRVPLTGSTGTVHLFTPDAGGHWYLTDRDVSLPEDIRYFGLCDLGLGFPELGWVGHDELMGLRGALGLPVEVETDVTRTLADGYERVGEPFPDWLER